jgi:hypothetical protein
MKVVRSGWACFSATIHACRHNSTSSGATVSFQEYLSTAATVQGQRQGGKDERCAREFVELHVVGWLESCEVI